MPTPMLHITYVAYPFSLTATDFNEQLLSMMRVAVLSGGVEIIAGEAVPPSQKLYIAVRHRDEGL